jgi:hypothetical protein
LISVVFSPSTTVSLLALVCSVLSDRGSAGVNISLGERWRERGGGRWERGHSDAFVSAIF